MAISQRVSPLFTTCATSPSTGADAGTTVGAGFFGGAAGGTGVCAESIPAATSVNPTTRETRILVENRSSVSATERTVTGCMNYLREGAAAAAQGARRRANVPISRLSGSAPRHWLSERANSKLMRKPPRTGVFVTDEEATTKHTKDTKHHLDQTQLRLPSLFQKG